MNEMSTVSSSNKCTLSSRRWGYNDEDWQPLSLPLRNLQLGRRGQSLCKGVCVCVCVCDIVFHNEECEEDIRRMVTQTALSRKRHCPMSTWSWELRPKQEGWGLHRKLRMERWGAAKKAKQGGKSMHIPGNSMSVVGVSLESTWA